MPNVDARRLGRVAARVEGGPPPRRLHRVVHERARVPRRATMRCAVACPVLIEWKGAHRAPGDEVVPADLRVDHVYLVSCKYLSRIVVNASPHHLFDRLLAGGHGRRGGDWFREVAPAEHDELFARGARASSIRTLPHDVDRARRTAAARPRARTPRRVAGRCRRASTAHSWFAAPQRIGAPVAGRDRPERRGDAVAPAADRERALLRARRVAAGLLAACASRRRGTGARHFELRAFDDRAARRRPADRRLARRSCAGATTAPSARHRRPRRGALEPRSLLRAARGEGVPRHPARRRSRLFPAALNPPRFPYPGGVVDNSGTWPALAARGLHKHFGPKVAVGHVDLDVAPGSFFGIVGPNGAGKTTTLAWRPGCCAPTAGRSGSTASTCGPTRSPPSDASACSPKISRSSNA